MNLKQHLLKSIQLKPNHSYAFLFLGNLLSSNETITLHDGTEMNQQQLILKSIHLNPNKSDAFVILGNTLLPNKTITLHDGTEMNQQQLYLKSIQLDPNNSKAVSNLGYTISPNKTITLHDGTVMNKQQLYLKSIQLNPSNSNAFLLLGYTLSPNETITLHDGTKMNQQQLYLKSIEINPNDPDAFFYLGNTLSHNETIFLHDGTEMNQQQLYLKSLDINNNASALFELSETLSSPDQTIELLNGKKFSKTELLNESFQNIILFDKKSFDSKIDEIGEGGYGRVCKTKLIALDKMVALKELKKGYSMYSFKELNEVKYIKNLRDHPNSFVICYGFLNQLASMNTIVLELMSHSLYDEIYKFKMNISEEKVIESVANGLKILSDFNLVHRDIKPNNILIGFDQKVKIADFGLLDLQHNLKSTQNSGTLIYQAPELRFETTYPITIAADMFSLGVTIIEMNIKQKLQVSNVYTFDDTKDKWTWIKKTGEQISVTLMMDSHIENLKLMTNEKLKNIVISCIQDDPLVRLTPTEILNLVINQYQ